jgi:hypothetical protein
VGALIGGAPALLTQDTSDTATATPNRPRAALPRCARVSAARGQVHCRTRTAELYLVREGTTLSIPGQLTARLQNASIVPATTESGRRRKRVRVTVSMEIVNRTPRAQIINPAGQAIYLRIGDEMLRSDRAAARTPEALDNAEPLGAGKRRTGSLRFELEGDAVVRLVRSEGRADLALTPFGALGPGRPRVRGVMRLELPTEPMEPLVRPATGAGGAAEQPASQGDVDAPGA